MSEVVISGYYGFNNAGDEAMLAAMIEALTEMEPDIGITVISGNPDDTRRRHGVRAVYRLHYGDIIKTLLKSRLLISGGGSLLQDVTSDRSLYYYLSIMLLAKKLGVPVMLYAQGIGPVRGALARFAVRRIANMADLITVRDEGSRIELENLGVTEPPVHVTADAVMAMHPVDREIGRSILRRCQLEGVDPLIGISVREWKDWSHYKRVLAEVADTLVTESQARVIFLPMQWPGDLEAARRITRFMKQPAAILEGKYTTGELLSLVGNLDILISVRLHALVFAAVMHVPMVGISYDPKIDRFLETLGERHVGTLQTVTAGSILAKVRDLWPEIRRPNREREEKIRILREKALYNAELALSFTEKK